MQCQITPMQLHCTGEGRTPLPVLPKAICMATQSRVACQSHQPLPKHGEMFLAFSNKYDLGPLQTFLSCIVFFELNRCALFIPQGSDRKSLLHTHRNHRPSLLVQMQPKSTSQVL